MTAADKIRNNIIDKLLTISDRDYLEALYGLVNKSGAAKNVIKLSEAQIQMLKMSEDDLKNGRLISQEEVDKVDLEWLKGL